MDRYDWIDFEPDVNDGGDPIEDADRFFLTIRDDGEELATIVHRTCGGRYPLDGPVAEQKRRNAQHIVDALNALDPEVI